jgi:hypothetical protein
MPWLLFLGMERPNLTQMLRATHKASVVWWPQNEMRNGVLIEGNLEQWAKSLGISTWVTYHLALFSGSNEIRSARRSCRRRPG